MQIRLSYLFNVAFSCILSLAMESFVIFFLETAFGLSFDIPGYQLLLYQQFYVLYFFPLPVTLAILSVVIISGGDKSLNIVHSIILALIITITFNVDQYMKFFSNRISYHDYLFDEISVVNSFCAFAMTLVYRIVYHLNMLYSVPFLRETLRVRNPQDMDNS